MAQSIPSSIAAPTDWTQMAGVSPSGGQTIPSAPSAPNSTSLMQQLGAVPTAPTAPMYTSSAAPATTPRLHPPTMQPMQSTQRLPITNQATSTIQARRQNRFAGIANAINSVTNEVQKRKFENITTDVTNISRAQGQIANAQQAAQSAIATLKDQNATPEAKKAAQQALQTAQGVIETNQKSMDTILKDDKRRKEMAKVFDVSFTDPSANAANKPYIDAGKAGIDAAKKSEAAGLSANTPEEKAIQEYNQKTQGGGFAQQFMSQQPQQMTVNPLYEAQLKQYTDQQKWASQYIIPRLIDQATREFQTRVMANTTLTAKKAEITERYYNSQLTYFGKIDAANIAGNFRLKGIASHNAQMGADAKLRADTALQLAGLKDNKGTWKAETMKNQSIASFTNEINRVTGENSKLQVTNDALQLKVNNGSATSEERRLLDENNIAIKMNNLPAGQMADERQKYTSGIYGIPVVSDPTATDSVTKGYVKNANPPGTPSPSATNASGDGVYPRFNIAPGISVPIALFGRSGTPANSPQNGPADDSASAAANQTDFIDSGTLDIQRGFQILSESDPDTEGPADSSPDSDQ